MNLMLDSGVLLEFERNPTKARAAISVWKRTMRQHRTTEAIVAQVWRGSGDPTIATTLNLLQVDGIGDGRQVGKLLGEDGSSDAVDASLVVAAKRKGCGVLTYDIDDIAPLAKLIDVAVVDASQR